MMDAVSAPVIRCGRRKGQSRAQTAETRSEEVLASAAMLKPIDISQIAVLRKAEWERIQNVNTLEREALETYEEMKEREALHLRSKEFVKNWSNTIAVQRQKRLKSKQLREEKEEEERKQIDIEEAKFQAEKRREAIEKAKTKMYYESDRIKKFHSALLFTEVMKEREAQIDLKNKRTNLLKKKEKELPQRELEEILLDDQRRAVERFTLKKKNTEDLLKQIEEKKLAAELEKLADLREGAEKKRLAREYEAEMNRLQQKKLAEKEKAMKDHLALAADRDLLRVFKNQKQEAEDEKIRNYVSAKKKMAGLRKAREEEVNRMIVERRDKMSGLLAQQMKQKVDNEDERIGNAVAELEAKSKKQSQEKEEKMKADIKAIAEHRHLVRRHKTLDESARKLQAIQDLHAIKEADDFFIAQQREKIRKGEEEEKKIKSMQIQQMADKKTMSLLEREAALKYAKQNEILIKKDEEQFQDYAKQVIDAVTKAGRNPNVLKKAAQSGTGGGHGPVLYGRKGIRPSYLAQDKSGVQLQNFQNSTTPEMKVIHDTGDIQQSKKKLGFTWW